MTQQDLAGKTKTELLALAREKKIKNRSRMTKAELIASLTALTQKTKTTTGTKAPEQPPVQPPEPIYTTGLIQEEQHCTEQIEEKVYELPPYYNETNIALLVRDPYWLYTYWDLDAEIKAQLIKDYGNWDHVPLSLRVRGEQESGGSQPEFFNVPVSTQTNNWYINVQPNRKYAVDLGYYSPAGEFVSLASSNTVTTPRDCISEVIDEEWMIIEEDFRRLYRLAGGDPTAGSVELVESLLKRLEREMGSAAVSSISSPTGRPQQERRFWLVLNTELIVYGATEPDATLSLNGQPVTLRPDGSFTVRLALPDGVQSLPVTARSADGVDQITITPIVSKETR
ncbi:MAG: DUF4912 domain-containing protein [Firmicutes bacterium]|nr:DUF4912 domain-containing protein [Bacillota bacterium]